MTKFLFEDTALSGLLESVILNNTTCVVNCSDTLYIFPIENILKP